MRAVCLPVFYQVFDLPSSFQLQWQNSNKDNSTYFYQIIII